MIIELILFISCSIIFIFHIFVSSNPFLDPKLFINLRFFACLILASLYGLLTVPIMIIIPLFMESLLKCPIDTIGYLQLPRGIGIFLSLFVSGKLTDKYDSRFLIGFALICLGVSNYEMTQWNFETTRLSIIWTAFLQGVGAGIMIIPVQVLAFAMIKPKQRTEAASILQFGRSIFSSVGISITLLILFQCYYYRGRKHSKKLDQTDTISQSYGQLDFGPIRSTSVKSKNRLFHNVMKSNRAW